MAAPARRANPQHHNHDESCAASTASATSESLQLPNLAHLPPAPAHVNLDHLIADVETSHHWSTRLEAMQAIRESHVKHTAAFTSSVVGKLVPVMCERAADQHHKVAQEVLRGICDLLPEFSKDFGENLKRLLPPLLHGLSDSKSSIRKLCNAALNKCLELYSPDLLCSVLSGLCRRKGDKLRLGCVEYMTQLVPKCTTFFSNTNHIAQVLQRVEPCLAPRQMELRKAAIALLEAVFRSDQPTFAAAILAHDFNARTRAAVIKVLSSRVRGFEQALSQAAAVPVPSRASTAQPASPASTEEDGDDVDELDPKDLNGQQEQEDDDLDNDNGNQEGGEDDLDTEDDHTTLPAGRRSFDLDLLDHHFGKDLGVPGRVSEMAPIPPSPSPNDDVEDEQAPGLSQVQPRSHRQQPLQAMLRHESSNFGAVTRESTGTRANGEDDDEDYASDSATIPTARNWHDHLEADAGPGAPSPVSPGGAFPPNDMRIPALVGTPRHPSQVDVQVSTVLNELAMGDDDSVGQALLKLELLLTSNTANVDWQRWLGQLVTACIDKVNSPSLKIRDRAVALLGHMAAAQPLVMSNSLEVVVQRLLDLYRQRSTDVLHVADESLHAVMQNLDPSRCFASLEQVIATQEGPVLCQALKLVRVVFSRMPSRELLDSLPRLVPRLTVTFASSDASIRRATMYCFVELHELLGDNFAPYSNMLSKMQRKLVTIYLERRETQK